MFRIIAICIFVLKFLVAEEEESLSWYQYDPITRTETWKLAQDRSIEWVYDISGNRIEWKDWTGTARFAYDKCKHLTESIDPDGVKKLYRHDARGNLLQMTYPSGEQVYYAYEPGGVLKTITVHDKKIIYKYDRDTGLLLEKQFSNCLSTTYQYDVVRRVTDIIHRCKEDLIAHFYFEYDAMDNRTLSKKTTPLEETTTRYIYDRLYRLIEVSCSDGSFEKYTYDAWGNRLSKETPKETMQYVYDGKGLLVQAGETAYTYNTDGCLIKKASPKGSSEYVYNAYGQLIGYEDEKYAVTFTYNGQGERLTKSVNNSVTRYTYEDVFPVFQLIQEQQEEKKREYLYDKSCLGYIEDGKVYYYLEDSPNNPVSIVVDEKGAVVEGLEYDAFGRSLFSSRASIQYNGEQVDGETGLIFLRTRYYDPEIGRFITPDTVPGSFRDPQSLNRYVYVHNNPINFCDPMGTLSERKKDKIAPIMWAKGVPIWQEGDPLPPEGTAWIVICARQRGIFISDPTKNKISRFMTTSQEGHGWIERIDSNGQHTSISTHGEVKGGSYKCTNDVVTYKHDRDTIRIAFPVPTKVAEQAWKSVEDFCTHKYDVIFHNCVAATAEGARVAGIDEVFYDVGPTYLEEGPIVDYRMKITPSSLYSSIEKKIEELGGRSTLPSDLRDSVLWMHFAMDDPFIPSMFVPKEAFRFEGEFSQKIFSLPQRGNFGGISLSKRAEMIVNLKEIYGAVFDEATQQLILVGKRDLRLPEMRLDDLAVAVQSIYGLKGRPAEDPGISIEPLSEENMAVHYFGATQDTAFGNILFEGDYTLKMLLLGRYPCSVAGFLPYTERRRLYQESHFPLISTRTWIIPDRIALVQSADGSAMVFEDVRMKCLSENKVDGQLYSFPPYEAFAQHFTENYDAIAAEYPIFSEVKRLGQITGIVKWLKDSTIPFDLAFFHSYAPQCVFTPLIIPLLQEDFIHTSGAPLFMQGGISLMLNTQNFTAREEDISALKHVVLESRPNEKHFFWELQDDWCAEAVPLFQTRKTGDFRKTFIDICFPVPGDFPLTLARFYDSFNENDVGLGRGWSILPFDFMVAGTVNFQVNDADVLAYSALVIREGQQQWVYTPSWYNVDGTIMYLREDKKQKVKENLDHTFTLFLKEGGTVLFSETGRLLRIADRQEIFTEYAYAQEGLTAIRHQNGKEISLSYHEGRLIGVVDPKGFRVSFSHNGMGDLCNAVAQAYEYDEDRRLTHIAGPGGEVVFSGSYDEYNRLSAVTLGGSTWIQDYDLVHRSATLIMPDGQEVQRTYDINYCLENTKETGWERTYDARGLLVQAISPVGDIWKFLYDDVGRLCLQEEPDGDKTLFQYDGYGRLIVKMQHVEPTGYKDKFIGGLADSIRYAYNMQGRVQDLYVGNEGTHFVYDENSMLIEVHTPPGRVFIREFDENLRLKSIADRAGVLQVFEYDEVGRVCAMVSSGGRMEYLYDHAGRMVGVKDKCGYTTQFVYDDAGELIEVRDAEGGIARIL